MPVTVRRAVPADSSVIVEFNCRMAEETEGKTLDPALLTAGVAAGLTDSQKAIYFLAEDEGRIVGQMMITREWSDWRNGWFWWIQSVYVAPESRRRGIFRSLYEHVHRSAQQTSEVIGLRLYVERENHNARQTYHRLGMEETPYLVLEQYPL